ncbi:hypothetical protein HYH03_006014 [Edaphochlamys debaryana]|uniref:RING-type domain-containing protein n=1 Tax=Edaphochlamys debaryana TaxID=47281 RepID=A0A835YDV0_9CHLO|nr:hypothetical protein HYH03_006014 [Edaphochlamys debaryana]|eukprot:KAG2495769.1 hypothetical protein HYH03_006014 [Edaphochlamys debaryana]
MGAAASSAAKSRKAAAAATAALDQLQRAIAVGNSAEAAAIVARTPTVLTVCSRGTTAWHCAAALPQQSIIDLLFSLLDYFRKQGVSVVLPSKEQSSAVSPDVTQLRDARQWTPLHVAAHAGCRDSVRSLLKRGADCWATIPGSGLTALHLAAAGGHWTVVEALLDNAPAKPRQGRLYVDAACSHGLAPLHFAVAAGRCGAGSASPAAAAAGPDRAQLETLKVLMRHGAAITTRGHTCNAKKQALPELASYHIPPNAGTHATPLHVAAARGDVFSVRFLLSSYLENVLVRAKSPMHDPRLQRNGEGARALELAQAACPQPLAGAADPHRPTSTQFMLALLDPARQLHELMPDVARGATAIRGHRRIDGNVPTLQMLAAAALSMQLVGAATAAVTEAKRKAEAEAAAKAPPAAAAAAAVAVNRSVSFGSIRNLVVTAAAVVAAEAEASAAAAAVEASPSDAATSPAGSASSSPASSLTSLPCSLSSSAPLPSPSGSAGSPAASAASAASPSSSSETPLPALALRANSARGGSFTTPTPSLSRAPSSRTVPGSLPALEPTAGPGPTVGRTPSFRSAVPAVAGPEPVLAAPALGRPPSGRGAPHEAQAHALAQAQPSRVGSNRVVPTAGAALEPSPLVPTLSRATSNRVAPAPTAPEPSAAPALDRAPSSRAAPAAAGPSAQPPAASVPLRPASAMPPCKSASAKAPSPPTAHAHVRPVSAMPGAPATVVLAPAITHAHSHQGPPRRSSAANNEHGVPRSGSLRADNSTVSIAAASDVALNERGQASVRRAGSISRSVSARSGLVSAMPSFSAPSFAAPSFSGPSLSATSPSSRPALSLPGAASGPSITLPLPRPPSAAARRASHSGGPTGAHGSGASSCCASPSSSTSPSRRHSGDGTAGLELDGARGEADATCPICMTERTVVRATTCNHGLCACCVVELGKQVPCRLVPLRCPMCRRIVSGFTPL